MTRTLALLAATIAGLATAQMAPPMGTKPSYLQATTPDVPNAAAIGRRIFVPGLEDDWVPQGIAVVDGHILVSSYKPTPDISASSGPCRVFRIDAATGKTAGQFDLPLRSCSSHAGGMAHLGEGRLVLADTQKVSLIDLPKALAAGTAEGAIRTVDITGALRGSFAASRGREAWIGHWSRDESKSRLFRLATDFFEHTGPLPADEKRTAESLPVPAESQGAAFDAAGNLWVSGSRGNSWSKLHRLDRGGKLVASYDVPIGIEGIAFDAAGKLWAVSESGTRKYLRWGDKFNFPFVFEIDVAKLPVLAGVDLAALWDFGAPAESERRFRAALEQASGDDALVLKTQIARTHGLRGDFDKAREVLREVEPAIGGAGAETRARYWLELGRTHASGRHVPGQVGPEARRLAREAYDKALGVSRPASLDALTIDALHMFAFVDTGPADQLAWGLRALAVVESSSRPDAKRWEASIRNNIGEALFDLGRHEDALVEFRKALALRERGTNAGATRHARYQVARTLKVLGKPAEAAAFESH